MKLLFSCLYISLTFHLSLIEAKPYPDHNTPLLSTLESAKKLKWEIGSMIGGATYLGLLTWNWGSSNSFKMHNEGWISTDTHSAGADKFGHMYSSFLINELFTKQLINKTGNVTNSAIKSTLFATGVMLWVETFDGYSVDHGFSYEDVAFNTMGIGLSYLKNTIPGLDEKIDFRAEYLPTHNANHVVTDYSGYTFLLVTRLNGFKLLKSTPLKYIELQLGYHTEGFRKNDNIFYNEKKAEVLFGVGLNLSEVFFKPINKHINSPAIDYADNFFRYFQMPSTYITKPLNTRTASY